MVLEVVLVVVKEVRVGEESDVHFDGDGRDAAWGFMVMIVLVIFSVGYEKSLAKKCLLLCRWGF